VAEKRATAARPIYARWQIWASCCLVLLIAVVLLGVAYVGKKPYPGTDARPQTTQTTLLIKQTSLPFKRLGTGNASTPRFTVTDGSWRVVWSFNCGGGGRELGGYNFVFQVTGFGSASSDDVPAYVDMSNSSSGVFPVNDNGTFNVSITSQCNWSIEIVQP
jgi:hypothetical protein